MNDEFNTIREFFRASADDLLHHLTELEVQLREKEQRIEELAADKERLDYLETHRVLSEKPESIYKIGDVTLRFGDCGLAMLSDKDCVGLTWKQISWRAAIDQARRQLAREEPK